MPSHTSPPLRTKLTSSAEATGRDSPLLQRSALYAAEAVVIIAHAPSHKKHMRDNMPIVVELSIAALAYGFADNTYGAVCGIFMSRGQHREHQPHR
jgi:hypothetical protein